MPNPLEFLALDALLVVAHIVLWPLALTLPWHIEHENTESKSPIVFSLSLQYATVRSRVFGELVATTRALGPTWFPHTAKLGARSAALIASSIALTCLRALLCASLGFHLFKLRRRALSNNISGARWTLRIALAGNLALHLTCITLMLLAALLFSSQFLSAKRKDCLAGYSTRPCTDVAPFTSRSEPFDSEPGGGWHIALIVSLTTFSVTFFTTGAIVIWMWESMRTRRPNVEARAASSSGLASVSTDISADDCEREPDDCESEPGDCESDASQSEDDDAKASEVPVRPTLRPEWAQ
eukprot:Amastigsp_a342902_46.p1 type:complete len:297 gc:universal Amastigsp_a342902_46:38-928(+)